jgi:hypothetical protein
MGDPTYDNAADLDAEGVPDLNDAASDDEGIMAPRDHPRAESHWGITADEMRRGESVALRATQEQPEVSPDDIDLSDADDDALLGDLAVGPLLQPGDEDVDVEDDDPTMTATAGSTDGIALAPEEAAMHITETP